MAKAVKLGRIWTVPIRGTYSLAVLILVVAGMSGWQMRSIAGGFGFEAYVLAGLGSAILFVWTVFAHETAHVLAARYFGAKVKGVTLSFLGGEAAISGQPGSPWQAVVVAVSGPIVSALCGGACIGAAFGTAMLSAHVLLSLSLAWVGFMSLLLGIANMIPAAPLDGGHVLQAVIWAKLGNRTRASAVAGFAGQVVGAAALAWAAWFLVRDGSILGAIATAIVGWPLWRGASATRRVAQQRERLAGLTVSAAMQRSSVVVAADTALTDVSVMLPAAETDYVAVIDSSDEAIAVVASGQLRRAAEQGKSGRVGDVARRARRRLITATVDEPLADVLERSYGKPRPAVVLGGDGIAGILSPKTIRVRLAASEQPPQTRRPAPRDTWPGRRATQSR
jgi:Zn-dependent protease